MPQRGIYIREKLELPLLQYMKDKKEGVSEVVNQALKEKLEKEGYLDS